MYFEPWMVAVMVAAYGICAWKSYTRGRTFGVELAVKLVLFDLVEGKAIQVMRDGKIVPYRANRNYKEPTNEGFYHQ